MNDFSDGDEMAPQAASTDPIANRCATLYAAHHGELLAHAERLLGAPDVAADVVQECFVKFFSVLANNEPRNCRAYLFAMVANRARDHWRQQARVDFVDSETDQRGDEKTPEIQLMAEQSLGRLSDAINALPPQQQRAFSMRRIDGLSLKEIAQRLGISAKTVENHLTAALRRVGEKMRQETN